MSEADAEPPARSVVPATSNAMPLDVVGDHVRAHMDSGAKAEAKAEDHYKAAGIHLNEAKARIEAGGEVVTWSAFLRDNCSISRSRAFELLALADGRTTLVEQREKAAERQRKHRAPDAPSESVTSRTAVPAVGAVTIGGATLYNADCRDILPSISAAHHMLTDPPYEAESHRSMRLTHKAVTEGISAALTFSSITEELRTFIAAEARRVCTGWALFFCQVDAVYLWKQAIEAASAKYKGPAIWVKPDSSPQFTGDKPAINFEAITLAWCGSGRSAWNGGGKRGTYSCNVNGPRRHGLHPTEKPTALAMDLVRDFTNPGDTIVDPFMGTGAIGVAALALGRRYIGIEMDPAFFEAARERIAAQDGAGTLFAANDNHQADLLALGSA